VPTKIEVRDVRVLNGLPGVYCVTATIKEPRRRAFSVLFSTDVETGEVYVSDPVMRGPRLVVEPARYGPRLGKEWVRTYYERIGRRLV